MNSEGKTNKSETRTEQQTVKAVKKANSINQKVINELSVIETNVNLSLEEKIVLYQNLVNKLDKMKTFTAYSGLVKEQMFEISNNATQIPILAANVILNSLLISFSAQTSLTSGIVLGSVGLLATAANAAINIPFKGGSVVKKLKKQSVHNTNVSLDVIENLRIKINNEIMDCEQLLKNEAKGV